MVTIGTLRYDIVADTARFTQGMVASRRELTSAKRIFESTRTPTERLDIAMGGLGNAFRKGAIDADTYARAVKKVKSDHAIAQGGIRGTVEQFRTMPGAVRSAANGFIAYRAAGMAAGQIGDAFNLAAELETTTASFEVLTGSAAQAASLVEQLRQYDSQTTFSFADTTQAAQKLMNFGVQTKDVVSTLRALGDISMGDSERLSRLALAFGQTTSMGRLMGDEVRQMVEAGFNPLQEISRTTGESMGELQKRMSAGGISSQELASAIASATEEGGRFFGMVEKRSQSTAGQIDLMRGEWAMLKADIATAVLPAVSAGVGTLRTSLAGYRGDTENSSQDWWQNLILDSVKWENLGFDRVPVIGGDGTGRDHQSMRVLPSTTPQQDAFAAQVGPVFDAINAAQQWWVRTNATKQANGTVDQMFGSLAEYIAPVGEKYSRLVASVKSDPDKQHKEAQEMRAKQLAVSEQQTAATQELIAAQPTPVN